MNRHVIALACVVILAVAMMTRWEKTTAANDLKAITYIRDRWTGQSYVQTWGIAGEGDGRGRVVPTFSSESREAYLRENMSQGDIVRELRYALITGSADMSQLTEKGVAMLEAHGYSADPSPRPGEAERLLEEISATKKELAERQEAEVLRLRNVFTGAWAVLMVASVLALVLPGRERQRVA